MLRRALTLGFLALPVAALAQPAGETRLRLGATGEVRVAPDELVATLTVEVQGFEAGPVQGEVNGRMAAALAAARSVEGVTATTGRYVTYSDARMNELTARQSLTLTATRGEPALALIARLQSDGLLMGELRWRLSERTAREARDAAMREAIRALRERAEMVARELNMRVAALTHLTVDAAPDMRPFVMAAPAPARAMAAAAPPPVVTAEDIPVSFQVTGDLLLRR
jgi:predicted secreted protein